MKNWFTKRQQKHRNVITLLGITLITLLFYTPFLLTLDLLGQRDWDFGFTMHAIPTWTITEFKQWPLWNPYLSGGYSLWGNPQNPAPFSLSFVMSLLAGPVAGLKLSIILNTIIGFFGMYLFTRRFDWPWLARILSGLLFAINGPMIHHIAEGHFVWVPFMYMPWIALTFFKSLEHHRGWIYVAALWLSAQFWAGGTYVFAFSIILIGMIMLQECMTRRSIKPFVRIIELGMASLVFCAPRLLPVLETLYKYPRLNDITLDTSVGQLLYALIDPNQVTLHQQWQGTELSAFVGLLTLFFVVMSALQWRRTLGYWIMGIMLFLIALGDFHHLSPWHVLHESVLGYFRFPTRFFTPLMFIIALLAGHGFARELSRPSPWIRRWAFASAFLLAFNLMGVLYPVLQQYAVDQTAPTFNMKNTFKQQHTSDEERYAFANSNMLRPLYQNIGTVNAYDALVLPTRTLAYDDVAYRGEVFLFENVGQARFASWSPNRWVIDISTTQSDLLVINQQYDAGWHSQDKHKVVSHQGLLAIPITPDDKQIILTYQPQAVVWGWWLFGIGLILIIADMAYSRR